MVSRRLRSTLAVGAVAGAALAVAVALPASAQASTFPTKIVVGRQSLQRGPQVTLSALTVAAPRALPQGTALPGEHYIVTDPDNNSVFSPGGPDARDARLPVSADRPVTNTPLPASNGFVGITGRQQASVNGGGDLEPPDQGLCTNGNTIVEFVNNALAAYTVNGQVLAGPIASPALFGLPADTFMADPRCYYDPPTGRWFLLEFDIGTTTAGGAELTPSEQYIAVSDTSNPLGSYHTYSIDTTDTATAGCPCFGDFDQIGADQYGFYISTNEFGVSSSAFNGAIIYAISKQGLEQAGTGSPLPVMPTYRLLQDEFGQPYHVAPALTPPSSAYANGREYFVESNSDANSDYHLIVYTMSNTNYLFNGGTPSLAATELQSEYYAFPPNANQKRGSIPLGASVSEPEGTLQADFNAIQEVTYAGGKLYAELDTATANNQDGIAWFVLTPTSRGPATTVSVYAQGYVTVPGANLLYPDIGVNSLGQGQMAFSVAGRNNYPSAASVPFGPHGPTGNIYIAAAGTAPEDGFTCYAAFVGPDYGGCRWGDYSMAVAAGGRIFMATELIADMPRDYYTNWATYVWSVPTS